jgi:hypothetical protein
MGVLTKMGILSTETSFGGNQISEPLFYYIQDNLPKGKTILELGSGWGTGQLMKFWNVWSIESDPKWFGKYSDTYFKVPLKEHEPIDGIEQKRNRWYDPDVLKECIKDLKYDLLLVDGPWGNRAGIIKYLDLFDTTVPIIFDDVRKYSIKTGKPFEPNEIIIRVSDIIGRPYKIHGTGYDLFGVIDGKT